MGRWISRDPAGEIFGKNLFSFVDNDPINGSDPDGAVSLVMGAAAAIIIIIIIIILSGCSPLEPNSKDNGGGQKGNNSDGGGRNGNSGNHGGNGANGANGDGDQSGTTDPGPGPQWVRTGENTWYNPITRQTATGHSGTYINPNTGSQIGPSHGNESSPYPTDPLTDPTNQQYDPRFDSSRAEQQRQQQQMQHGY